MNFNIPNNFLKTSWFYRPGYHQGVFWAILIVLFSSACDVLMRYLGKNISSIEIIFFRFLFGWFTLIPMMFSQGVQILKTNHLGFHVLRAVFGVSAFFIDCYAIQIMALNEYSVFVSTQPLFFLPLAVLFLGEKLIGIQVKATIVGFLGVLLIQQAGPEALKVTSLFPMIGAIFFALLDLFTKKMVDKESVYSLLFYFSFGTTLLSLIPTLYYWHTPTLSEWGLLILLGVGANLIQYCLVRSFIATEASRLMPFRYVYFIFSILFGYVFFLEIPNYVTIIGAFFIFLGTIFVSYKKTEE